MSAVDIEAVLTVLKSIPDRLKHGDMGSVVERAMRLNLDEDDARVLGNVAEVSEEDTILAD